MNVPGSGMWAVSNTRLAYVLPSPHVYSPGCTSCGHPFTDFDNRIYVVGLHRGAGTLFASAPHLAFRGATGYTICFDLAAGDRTPAVQKSQLLLADPQARTIKAITASNGANVDPCLSRNLVTWQIDEGTPGNQMVGVLDPTTGPRWRSPYAP